jgi:hypothetical protein
MCAGGIEQMNLTLSVDERLVKDARQAADALGKSLNQLIREYLEQLTARDRPADDAGELRRLTKDGAGRSRGWTFKREELHEHS